MTTPSCKSCAFRLGNVQKDVGSDYAGTSAPQVDICTYFDMVLGSFDPEGEGALQDDDAERIASQCKAYLSQGDDAAKRVAEYLRDRDREPGALGHMGAPLGLTLPLEVKGESGQSVKRSCGGCAHFLWPEELRDNGLPTVSKQGRGAGMCVAHGKMQDAGPGARRTVAKDCGEFSYVPDSQSDEAKAYRKELLSMASHPAHLAPLLADSGVGTSLGEQSAESGPAQNASPPTPSARPESCGSADSFPTTTSGGWTFRCSTPITSRRRSEQRSPSPGRRGRLKPTSTTRTWRTGSLWRGRWARLRH